jgi:protein TonB
MMTRTSIILSVAINICLMSPLAWHHPIQPSLFGRELAVTVVVQPASAVSEEDAHPRTDPAPQRLASPASLPRQAIRQVPARPPAPVLRKPSTVPEPVSPKPVIDESAFGGNASVHAPSTERTPTAMQGQTAPPEGGSDHDDALARYNEAVWNRVREHTPPRVMIAGTVSVRFRLSRDGAVLSAEVAQSGGRPALDDLALAILRQSEPFPEAPVGATADDRVFLIPFKFHARR